jgi:hypothetical protein
MNARARRAVGCAALLAYLAVYVVLAASLGAYLATRLPFWGSLVFYAIAGIAWAAPLKPLIDWMKRP